MTIEDVDRAIQIACVNRNSHAQWLNWYKQHPGREDGLRETVGDAAYQQERIQEYDHILAVLNAARLEAK